MKKIDCLCQVFQLFLVEEYLSVWKSGLNTFFKRINYINFLTGCQEHEWYFTILEHIEDFVKHHLFGWLDVVINILKDENNAEVILFLEMLLNFVNHFDGVVFLYLFHA